MANIRQECIMQKVAEKHGLVCKAIHETTDIRVLLDVLEEITMGISPIDA